MLPSDRMEFINSLLYELEGRDQIIEAIRQLRSALAVKLLRLADGLSWYSEKDAAPSGNEWRQPWYTFCRTVYGRIISDHYAIGMTTFTPTESKVEIYKLQKEGFPPVFWEPVVGIQQDS